MRDKTDLGRNRRYDRFRPRLCENYRGGGKATKMAEFMASLVELSHKYIAFKKRAAPKRDELRVFTQPRPEAVIAAIASKVRFIPHSRH